MVFIQHSQGYRHSLPEITIGFRDDNSEPINQVRPQFPRLDVLGGKLRYRRNESDLPNIRMIGIAIIVYQRFHAGVNPAKIAFAACNITKEGMEKREGHAIAILPGATIVPSGVVRLMYLQEQGWSYVRP